MKNTERFFLLLMVFFLLPGQVLPAHAAADEFSVWLAQVRSDALTAGISAKTVDEALGHLEAPEPQVLKSDRNQPEKKQSLKDYVASRVSRERIAEGRRMLDRYPTWLKRVERKYRVQRRFLVALWGIESTYGRYAGTRPVISSLATLAYQSRRGDYFRRELIEALKILDAGHVSLARMRGSWAGAMGPFQFMPSSYRHYAVDADGDGRINIWGSVPDALASAANYLAEARWHNDQTWGRPVKLPKSFDTALAGLDTRLPLSRWQALGVRRANGQALPTRNLKASLLLPDGPQGPAYLVYDNFRALLRWNRSYSFAVAVGSLADSL